jgi:hypothetical protein
MGILVGWLDSQSHTQDLVLKKSIYLGLVPIIQLAEQVVNPNTELDRGSSPNGNLGGVTKLFNFLVTIISKELICERNIRVTNRLIFVI